MTNEIKVGSMVVLKSDSTFPMTVESLSGAYAKCVYLNKLTHKFETYNFPLEALQITTY